MHLVLVFCCLAWAFMACLPSQIKLRARQRDVEQCGLTESPTCSEIGGAEMTCQSCLASNANVALEGLPQAGVLRGHSHANLRCGALHGEIAESPAC